MHGLMQEIPLMISSLIRYAAEYHGDRQVVSRTVEGPIHRYGYAECERRARRVANVMARGSVSGTATGSARWPGTATGTWSSSTASRAWAPCCTTVNPRLFTEQIVYIVNHAADRVLFVDLTSSSWWSALRTGSPRRAGRGDGRRGHMPETALEGVLC